jgi:hypothetical protein
MTPQRDNGAVTAFFREWGGRGLRLRGDAVRRMAGRGSHRGETFALGLVIALVVAAMVLERLGAWFGMGWAVLAWLPALVLTLHLAGIVLGMLARIPARLGGGMNGWSWRCWALMLSGWAVWAWSATGWTRWVALAWLGLMALNLAAAVLLGWRGLMEVRTIN